MENRLRRESRVFGAAIGWLIAAIVLFILSTQTFTPRDQKLLDAGIESASLAPSLSLPRLGFASDTIISVGSVDTSLPLYLFMLVYGGIEAALAYSFSGREEKLVRPLIRALGVFLVFWSFYGHEPFWDALLGAMFPGEPQLLSPSADVVNFAAQHMELVIISSALTVLIGLTVGVLVTRQNYREFLPLVSNAVNIGQTLPTLAIVAIMVPVLGFGFWPAIVALVAYGLLPVVRNTVVGFESVDAFIIDSARGMGMTPTQILFQIELPIASRIIMAGIRTSMVINVGTATLGAFVGSGGLGSPISSGLSLSIDPLVVLGAIPAALLAILIDYILGRIEYVITPRGLQIEQ